MIHASSALSAQTMLETPLGTMLLACTDRGLAGAWFIDQKHVPSTLLAPHRDSPLLAEAKRQLGAYWRNPRQSFSIALDPQGSEFQHAVWHQLKGIAPGQTTTYGEIAAAMGRQGAARAVGAAVGRNPLSIIVPCHRVLGARGALTGYAGGLDRKRSLLRLEAEALAA